MAAPMLFDAFGVPVAGEKLPAGLDVFYQWPVYDGFTTWGTKEAKCAIEAHELGEFPISGRLFWAMLGDPRVLDGLEKRALALRMMRVTVRPGKGQRAKTLAKKYEQLRDRIFRPETMSEMLDRAIMMGPSVAQPIWRYDEQGGDNPAVKSTARKWFVPRVQAWEPTLVRWVPGPWLPYWAPNQPLPPPALSAQGQLTVITRGSERGDFSLQVPVTPGTGQWLLFNLSGDLRPWMHGRIRAIWRPWIFRLLALLGHVRFNDVHGLPIRKAKIPMGMRETQAGQTFFKDVQNLGQLASLLLPQFDREAGGTTAGGADLELLEAKSMTWRSFIDGMAEQGKEITICLTGGTQSTEAVGGNYKGAEEQREIRHEVKAATAIAWGLMENEQMCEPFALVNGYDREEAPVVEFDISPPANRGAEAKAKQEEAKALTEAIRAWWEAKRAGADVPLETYLAERGLALPEATKYGKPTEPPPSAFPGAQPGDEAEQEAGGAGKAA